MVLHVKHTRIVCMVVLVAAAWPLLASGGSEPEAATGPAQVSIWGWPSADQAFEAVYPAFQEQFPDIEVTWEMKSGVDETRDNLTAAIAAGSGAPDISMIEINDIDKFVLFGGLVNLLQEPYNAGRYEDDFVRYKWQQATTLDGTQLVAFPWDIGPATLFYRRDVLENAGLPSDPAAVEKMVSTWEGYLETGRKVNDPDNGVWWTDNAGQVPYIYHSHKNLFDRELNIAVDNPKTRKALEIAKTIRTEGLDLQSTQWSEEWYAGLAEGRIATVISGSWFGGFLKSWVAPEAAGEWGIVPVPEDPLQNWGGSFMAITEQSKNKLAAWKFIEFVLAGSEPQNVIFEAVDYFPALKPAWGDPLYDEPDPYFGGQKTRQMWKRIATSQGEIVTTALDAAAEDAFVAEVTTFLEQGLTVDQAMENIVRAIREQTAQDREALMKKLGM